MNNKKNKHAIDLLLDAVNNNKLMLSTTKT